MNRRQARKRWKKIQQQIAERIRNHEPVGNYHVYSRRLLKKLHMDAPRGVLIGWDEHHYAFTSQFLPWTNEQKAAMRAAGWRVSEFSVPLKLENPENA